MNFIEGSFSAPIESGHEIITEEGAFYHSNVGNVGVIPLVENVQAQLTSPEPNTNLLYCRTVLPLITGNIEKGRSLIIAAFLGDAGVENNSLPEMPNFNFDEKDGQIIIQSGAQKRTIDLKEY